MIVKFPLLKFFFLKFAILYPIGKAPFAQGTFASLITVILSYFFLNIFNKFYFIFVFILLLIFSFYSIQFYIKYFKKKDPPEVVADELIGQMVSLSSIFILNLEIDFYYLLISFLTFRFFDITKLGLRRVENLPGAWGVLLDDIVAGVYSCIAQVIIWKFLFLI